MTSSHWYTWLFCDRIVLIFQHGAILPKGTSTPVAEIFTATHSTNISPVIGTTPGRHKSLIPRRLMDDLPSGCSTVEISVSHATVSHECSDAAEDHSYSTMTFNGSNSSVSDHSYATPNTCSTKRNQNANNSFGDHSYATPSTCSTKRNQNVNNSFGDHSYATLSTCSAKRNHNANNSFGDHSYATPSTCSTKRNQNVNNSFGDHSYATPSTCSAKRNHNANNSFGDHSYATPGNTCTTKRTQNASDHTYSSVEESGPGHRPKRTVASKKKLLASDYANHGKSVLTLDLKALVSKISSLDNVAKGTVSVLAKHEYSDLCQFSWDRITQEMECTFPELTTILRAVMSTPGEAKDKGALAHYLGAIYSIMMKARHPRLSLVQTIMSVCMVDSIANQKVRKNSAILSKSKWRVILMKFSSSPASWQAPVQPVMITSQTEIDNICRSMTVAIALVYPNKYVWVNFTDVNARLSNSELLITQHSSGWYVK